MKKFTKVAAILAASAILFGGMFMSCSDSDDSNDGTPSTPVSDKTPAPAVTFTSATETVAKAALGEATAATVASSDNTVATATVSEGTVTIVSVKAGSATITAKAEGYNDASIPVTVAENGAITLGSIIKFSVKSSEPVTPPVATGTVWSFENETVAAVAVDKEFTPDQGSDASLKVFLATDFKVAGDSDKYVQAGKNSKAYDTYASNAKGGLLFTLNAAADVELTITGSGAQDDVRWVVITDEAGSNIIKYWKGLANNTTVTDTIQTVPAGTYKVWMNGSRLHNVKVTKK